MGLEEVRLRRTQAFTAIAEAPCSLDHSLVPLLGATGATKENGRNQFLVSLGMERKKGKCNDSLSGKS
jgi:hypothetical protein